MCIDQEFPQELPNIKVINTSSCDEDEYINCQTPKSSQYLIPKILSCPPAPKKLKRVSFSSCKRKLIDEFKFIQEQEEIESFFRFVNVNSSTKKRRCLV